MISKIKEKLQKTFQLISEHGEQAKIITGKSKLRQFFEIIMYNRLYGFDEAEYYVLSLYKGNKDYLSLREHGNLVRKYNPPIRGQIEFNKYVFFTYMKAHKIPTPECFGIFHSTLGFSVDYGSLKTIENIRYILTKLNRPVVFKPVGDTSGGKGVAVIDRYYPDEDKVVKGDKRISLEEVYKDTCLKSSNGVLIQEKIIQHGTVSRIHPSSVNSARIVTFRSGDEIEIIGAAMKFGDNGKGVDNSVLAGGVFANIDLDSGIVGNAYRYFGNESLTHHPYTREKIAGLQVPFWDKMKETVIKAHRCFIHGRTFGWDVACGTKFPILIEMNGQWEHNHLQKMGASLKETSYAKVA